MRLILLLFALTSSAFPAQPEVEQPTSVFRDEISVRRVIADIRVLDHHGDPILGLDATDFDVALGGIKAEIESAEWVSTATRPRAPRNAQPESAANRNTTRQEGRLIVLLVQTHLETVHLTGLYRMSTYAAEMLGRFGPEDRVALAVHSSHLDLIGDFTNDFDALAELLNVPDLLEHRPQVVESAAPSLAAHFDTEAARRAARPSHSLRIIGEALQNLPGPKTVILMGWGLGTYTSHGVVLGPQYARAVDALAQAQATVFVLDVTDADFHSLEAGLKSIAEHTGGRYERTHKHPGVAVNLVLRALQGFYELVLIPAPEILSQRIHLDVEVNRRGAEVMAPPYVVVDSTSPVENAVDLPPVRSSR